MNYVDKEKRCIVCRFKGVDLHHVKSRGSGGSDEKHNLMPLCHEHHTIIHNMGTYSFTMRFVGVSKWLYKNGWDLDKFSKKWINDKEGLAI